jgi:hypothetical protein
MVKMFPALAILLLAGALCATLGVDAYTVTPSTLRPGEEGAITFTIKNVVPSSGSADPLDDVQVFFSPSTGMEFKAKSPFVVGTIDSGGSAIVSVPFRVLSSAKGGVITATFYISQKDESALKTLNAIIKVINSPVLTLSSDKQTILSTDSIKLSITNNGGTASRAILKIEENSGFSLLGASQVFLGDIQNSTTVLVPIDSSNAKSGVRAIPFILTYQEEGGDTINATKYLTVSVKKESEDIIFTQEGKVVASQDNELSLRVKNNGKPLSNVRLFWTDSGLKAKQDNQVRLGDLATGAQATATFLVSAEGVPSGVQDSTLKLAWSEGGAEKEELLTVPIVVSSDADAMVYIDAKPTPVVADADLTFSVTVSNVGSSKIQNVEVTLEDSSAFDVFNVQRSQYIGGLEPDDFSSVSYKLRVKNVQPGNYPLNVKVRYKDTSGQWVDKQNSFDIAVRPADAAAKNGNGSLPIYVGGAVVALAAGYWYFRMRKKEKGK